MSSPTIAPPSPEQVTRALDGVQDPEIHRPITDLGMVKNVAIAADGTVGVITNDPQPGPAQVLGRIKLVNPPETQLVRGDDGLFRMKDGSSAAADVNVKLSSGTLERSNVNPVDAMVSMISLSRQFEMQMSMLKNAENNASKATQILALS